KRRDSWMSYQSASERRLSPPCKGGVGGGWPGNTGPPFRGRLSQDCGLRGLRFTYGSEAKALGRALSTPPLPTLRTHPFGGPARPLQGGETERCLKPSLTRALRRS